MTGRRPWKPLLILALVAVACGPPVQVRRVAPRDVSAELARSALNSNHPTLFSENVLDRWALGPLFARDPAAALAALHERLGRGASDSSVLFALAELCFLHGDASGRREYHLAAAVYAFAYLFPAEAVDRPEAFDPRLRIAADLYNRGLAQGFAAADRRTVDLRSGDYPLPFGQRLAVRLDEHSLLWANRALGDFVPLAELEVRGLGSRFRSAGVGAPLAARTRPLDAEAAPADFLVNDMQVPVTAVLRIDDPRRQVMQPQIDGSLHVYSHFDAARVEIGDESVPLEAEPSAALAYALSQSRLWRWERRGFLRGDLFRGEIERPLAFLEPYRPGRIPVVFVHGTASSPLRWADMVNVLMNSWRLRGRYQFWFFFYSTGSAIPYSGLQLRQALRAAVDRIDPLRQDPALSQMVVIGHSQGGLLARLTAIEPGEGFWKGISARPIDELNVSEATRELLREAFIFEPLPFVRRLVFLATPHRGSFVAEYSAARLLARFVEWPQSLASATTELITGNPDALRFDPRRTSLGAVYGMQPGNPFLTRLVDIPLAPHVKAHSIIPVRGDPPPQGQSDGVVRFESAHLDWVESELVIPRSGHSVQSNPLAIEEVRRILVAHADDVCRDSRVACPLPGLRPSRFDTANHQ